MSKPEVGLSMLHFLTETFVSLLNYLENIDVKYVELTDEGLHTLNIRRAKKLKEIAETCNLEFFIHAPGAGINIATPEPALRRMVLKRLTKSIIIAGKLDCRLWLFHPGSRTGLSPIYPGKDWKLNLESVRVLLSIARQEGVNIAIENTPEPFPYEKYK